jgi:hypothetical protein
LNIVECSDPCIEPQQNVYWNNVDSTKRIRRTSDF